ncbi:MAG: potassium transporter TrkG, partial [Planctomycetota bacterium]|nr:potassium transporter TrkG [Planctomycetota bacterium]
VMFFMLLAGINFSLHFGLIRGKFREFLKNPELRFFLCIQLVAAGIIVAMLLAAKPDAPVEETVRSGLFYTVSIGTCTGFCTVDYEQWPHICRLVLMVLMFIGACSGSTTGALKSVRLLIMLKSIGRAIKQLINPRAVMVVKLGETPLDESAVSGVAIFICVYLFTFMVASVCLIAQGLDIVTAAGSVASNMGGVGPGFGLTGPMTTYSQVPIVGKGILIVCMLMGRLEVFGVLVLFSASAWRK